MTLNHSFVVLEKEILSDVLPQPITPSATGLGFVLMVPHEMRSDVREDTCWTIKCDKTPNLPDDTLVNCGGTQEPREELYIGKRASFTLL